MKKRDSIKKMLELYISFFSIGLFTIGGGLAMIPLIEKVAVKDKKWLTEDEMVDCITVCQSLPGVIAINLATYIGKKKYGVKGSCFATLGVITPSFIIILVIASFLENIETNTYIQGAFVGIKAAVCGLITVTAYRIGKKTLKSICQWIIATLCFVAIAIFKVTAVWPIMGAAIIGILVISIKRRGIEKG